MSAKTFFITTLLVISVCALVAGCGDDNPTAPDPTSGNEAPILPPQNVIATKNGNDVTITWSANTQANLRGYRVYRHDVANSTIATLTATEITATSYVDINVDEGRYEYRVTSVSSKGEESSFSARTIGVGEFGGETKYDRKN